MISRFCVNHTISNCFGIFVGE